jgi:hypothetical protein
MKAVERELLKGKDDLQSVLSRQSFRAVERWVATLSIGIVSYVPE